MKKVIGILVLIFSLPFFNEIMASEVLVGSKNLEKVAALPTIAYPSSSYSFTVNQTISNAVPTISGSPTSFTVSPQLPAGLSINSTNGVISGVPSTQTSNTSYVVTATNSSGNASTTISIQVFANPCPIAFNYSPASQTHTNGTAISALTPTITSGFPNAFSISPVLPSGLSFNTINGVISGTPSAIQTATSYTISASNNTCSATTSLNITVNPPVSNWPSYTPKTIVGQVGQAITTLTPVITNGPVSFTISPALPAGLTINPTTGAISGTPTTVMAPRSYTITITHAGGSETDIITISINDSVCPIAVSYPSANVFVKGNFVSIPIASILGVPNSFQILPGSTPLPTGLTVNPATGTISGIPTDIAPLTSYTIRANNGTCSNTSSLSITVNPAAPSIVYTPKTKAFVVNQVATPFTPVITNGPVTVTISPALPTGLILDPATGAISGTPTAISALRAYTVTVTNAGGSSTDIISFEVTAPCPIVASYTPSTQVFTAGRPINALFPTLIGVANAFAINPALPSGLTFDPVIGRISGTPTVASAPANYVITANNNTCSDTAVVKIEVRQPCFSFPINPLPTPIFYVANQPLTYATVAASEWIGNESGIFTISPSLPPGMNFNSNTGVISGTPTSLIAPTNYTICFTNACGSSCRIITLTPANTSCPLNVSYSPYRNNLTKGRSTSIVPTIGAGVPTTFSVIPNLPAGLSLNSTNGNITGTPTALSAASNYIITANNAVCSDTAVVNIRILPETPTIAYSPKTKSLAANQPATSFTPIITGDSVIVTISPALPVGLSINPITGTITGTPTSNSPPRAYTVTAFNSSGSGTDVIVLSVESATCPLVVSYTPSKIVFGTMFPITPLMPTVSNGVPNTYTVSPSLPAGLSLNPLNGVISGRPSSVLLGDLPATNYVITANNAACSDTAVVNISVKREVICLLILYTTPSKSFLVNQPIIPTWNPIRNSSYYNYRDISFVDPFINQSNFRISPALPAGMVMNENTGEISGTPLAPSPMRRYSITFNNPSDPCYTSQEISFEIIGNPCPLTVSYSSNKYVATKNSSISEIRPTIAGGLPTVYTIFPNLPSGLNFNLFSGIISGTPTSLSPATLYTVTASNATCSDTALVNIRIRPEAPRIIYTPKTRILTVNQVVSPAYTPVVTGDSITFSIVPTLPQGLSLNRNTGAIEGLPNVITNLTSYVVTASNSGGSATDIITLQTTPSSCPLNVNYPSVKNTFVKGNPITSISPSIISGSANAFSISPALPSGLAFNAVNGIITGTPTSLIAATNYVVTATNATCTDTANVNIRIKPAAPLITYTPKSLSFVVNQLITPFTPLITGDSVTVGISPSLPAGLSLDTRTGVISGTPLSSMRPVAYTISVTNSSGSSTDVIAIQITASNCPIVANYSSNKKVFIKGIAIEEIRPNLLSGVPNSFTISPILPAGLSLNAINGTISGTPTALLAATNFVVTATTGNCSDTLQINIRIKPTAPSIAYPEKSKAYTVNQNMVAFVPTIIGDSVLLNISPALPSGLNFNLSTGTISGTPTAVSPLTLYTVTAFNSSGSYAETLALQIVGSPPIITYSPSIFNLTKGVAISQISPLVTGQVDIFTISPNLPAGLTFNQSNGTIAGTPTVLTSQSSYVVTSRNLAGTDTANIRIRVIPQVPTISYAVKNKTFEINQSISPDWAPIVTGDPVSFSISPALPPGLVLNQTTGAITGTPVSTTATRSYTVTAVNASGSASDVISITILGSCPILLNYGISSQIITLGNAMTRMTPVITAGVPTVFSISPALPSGLNFNPIDGSISGTPISSSPQTNYIITANNNSCSATSVFTLKVNDALPKINYVPTTRVLFQNQAINPVWNVISTGGAITNFAISPSLPNGLQFNTLTGAISGTPLQLMAPKVYTILAYNEAGVGTTLITLEVVSNPCPIEISYAPNSIEFLNGKAITNLTPTITKGSPQFFSITPNLPAGLSLNAVNGVISGVPVGVYSGSNFVVTAAGASCFGSTNLTIRVKSTPPTILYNPNFKTYIANQVSATSWIPILTGDSVKVSIAPALPQGLTIDSNTGVIQGTPNAKLAPTSYTVIATNSAGSSSTAIVLAVNEAPPTNLNYAVPTILVKGQAISPIRPSVTGVVTSFTINPSLPVGLSLNLLTGEISGTPSQVQNAINYSVRAFNSSGSVATTITLTIQDLAPSGLSYTTPNVFTKGKSITTLIPLISGSATNFSISPTLPAGLEINQLNGSITGTPTVSQNALNYVVTATNSYGKTTATISIAILEPIVLATQIPISGDDLIQLYPNPFSNNISLDFGKELGQNADIIISDMQGNVRFRKSNISSRDKIDVSNLSDGSYILRLISIETQKEFSFKIVKFK